MSCVRPIITFYCCVYAVWVVHTRPDILATRLPAPEHTHLPYGVTQARVRRTPSPLTVSTFPGRVCDHRKLLERGFLLCTASIYHYNNTYADLDMCCARILRARALLGTQLTIRPKFRGYSRRPRSVSGARLGPEKLFTLGLLLRPASLYHIRWISAERELLVLSQKRHNRF